MISSKTSLYITVISVLAGSIHNPAMAQQDETDCVMGRSLDMESKILN